MDFSLNLDAVFDQQGAEEMAQCQFLYLFHLGVFKGSSLLYCLECILLSHFSRVVCFSVLMTQQLPLTVLKEQPYIEEPYYLNVL